MHVRDASTAAEANAAAKLSQAYRIILERHPPDTWERRYVGTELKDKIGFWMVEFEVCRKEAEK